MKMETRKFANNELLKELSVLESIINKAYDRCNDNLKLSEAKNGALITFTTAIIFGVSNLLKDIDLHCYFKPLVGLGYLFLLGALYKSGKSFLPKLKHNEVNTNNPHVDDILFSSRISEYEFQNLWDEYRKLVKIEAEGLNNSNYLIESLAQVLAISKISEEKFSNFKVAILMLGFGSLLSIVPIMVSLLF